MRKVAGETGIPVVFIDTFYDYHPECRYVNDPNEDDYKTKDKTKCFGRSMIGIAKRIEELAVAIGGADVEQIEEGNKHLACESAQKFTDLMKRKQEEGLRVRVMTTINAIKKDSGTGEDYFEIRTLDPIDLWVPRTLEELGMPILHHDEGSQTLTDISTKVTGPQFFPECPPGGGSAKTAIIIPCILLIFGLSILAVLLECS